jgi:hypothetical protein
MKRPAFHQNTSAMAITSLDIKSIVRLKIKIETWNNAKVDKKNGLTGFETKSQILAGKDLYNQV